MRENDHNEGSNNYIMKVIYFMYVRRTWLGIKMAWIYKKENAFINASKRDSHDADELFSLQSYLDVADLKVKRKNDRIEIAVKHCPVTKHRIGKLSTIYTLEKRVINFIILFKNTISGQWIWQYSKLLSFSRQVSFTLLNP
jgi:hypothetical protein